MARPVKLAEVLPLIRESYRKEAVTLSGGDQRISRADETKVRSADLRGAIAGLRDGRPGAHPSVNAVVDEAMRRAAEQLAPVNTRGPELLSRAEVDRMLERRPDLGQRLEAAYLAVRQGAAVDPAVASALGRLAPAALERAVVSDVKSKGTTVTARVDARRDDGGQASFNVTIKPPARGQPPEVVDGSILAETPLMAPALSAALQAVVAGPVLGALEQLDARTNRATQLVAAGIPTALRSVDLTTGRASAARLSARDEATARSLAVALTRTEGRRLAENGGAPAVLEFHLRTGGLTPAALERITDPNESAVGLNPATDLFQFRSPGVWGDNAVFVTFEKAGGVRVESVN